MATEKRLIYMDDTMDELRAYADRKHQAGHTELANGILKAVNYIHNEISRADAVEVVHGRWVAVPSSDMMTGKAYKCSECKKMRYGSWMPNYCPNCGAKMDGDKHGS